MPLNLLRHGDAGLAVIFGELERGYGGSKDGLKSCVSKF